MFVRWKAVTEAGHLLHGLLDIMGTFEQTYILTL